MSLKDKLIWVTGSSGYIGSNIARELKAREAKVITHGRKPSCDQFYVQGDCENPIEVRRMVRNIYNVEILICCVGGVCSKQDNAVTCTSELIENTVSKNLSSAIFCSQEVIPIMKRNGFGKIVFIGSDIVGHPRLGGQFAIYASIKAALHEYSLHLSKQLKPDGIMVNCVAPGTIPRPPHKNSELVQVVAKKVADLVSSDLTGQIAHIKGVEC